MKTNTHTPGPWRVSGCTLGKKLLIEHGDIDERAPIIGSVYIDDGNLPQRENAALIAAAPELLHACELAMAKLSWCSCECENSPAPCFVCALKTAIAKAKGEEEDTSCPECERAHGPHYKGKCDHA